jgi:cytochrome c5
LEEAMNARASVLAMIVLVGCAQPKPSGQAAAAGDTTAGAAGLPMMQQRLLQASNIALPPGTAPESLPEPTSAGAKALGQYCTQCHALPSPAMHGPIDWTIVLRRMWVRIDMMAGYLGLQAPSTAERAQLLTYLQKYSLKVAENLPPGPGKDQFQATCSRCHALADPKVHSPPDWPVVVMRMEKNMEKMKVSGVTRAQAEQIVTYLQAASNRRR